MYVVAGLGNPTGKYEKTRHNIGFDVIDIIAGKYNISMTTKKHQAVCGAGIVNGERVLLVKPQTYMNLSGESIGAILKFYRIDPENRLIVVYDDISLPLGKIRIRKKGSPGGHNGIKNIISHIGGQDFLRIKIGVGEKPPEWDLADYVLSRFSREEQGLRNEAVEEAVRAVDLLISDSVEQAMNMFN